MYSAVSVNGKRLYKLAREGLNVERPAKKITINHIKIISANFPDICISVDCSKGTYIRTLIADIGKKLGCGACMASLVRTRSGIFEINDAVTLDELKKSENAGKYIKFVDAVLPYKKATILPEAEKCLLNGNKIYLNEIQCHEKINKDENIFIYGADGTLCAVYRLQESGEYLKSVIMLNDKTGDINGK